MTVEVVVVDRMLVTPSGALFENEQFALSIRPYMVPISLFFLSIE
jgi:hypothetical protein